MLSVAIESEVGVFSPETVVLQDVQHASHLAEDEHSRAFLLEPRQQLVKSAHFAAIGHQVMIRGERRP